MGLIEKWNKFSKKSIYVNSHFEIPVGRLLFTLIVTFIESVSILLLTGNISAALPLFSNMLLTLKEQCEEEACEICGDSLQDDERKFCKDCKKEIKKNKKK